MNRNGNFCKGTRVNKVQLATCVYNMSLCLRYKEMRKAALAARTSQFLDSGAEDNTTPVTGYVPRYLRNRDGSGASVDRYVNS